MKIKKKLLLGNIGTSKKKTSNTKLKKQLEDSGWKVKNFENFQFCVRNIFKL